MIQPDKPTRALEDEDLDLELPDEDGEPGLREDEAFLPDDDSDLGLDSEDKPLVGLDIDVGIEGTPDSEVDDDEDEESWLEDGELDPSLTSDEDDEDDEDDEEGGGDDTEPARENGDDWGAELPFEEDGAPIGDSGEEGFGEDAAATDVDIERLPPLDDSVSADAEEREADALSAELLDEIAASAEAEERVEDIAPGLRCTRMASSQIVIETLLRLGRPLAALAASGDAGLGWDGSLLVSSAGSSLRPERRFAGPDALFALAALQTEAALLVALATPAGLLCSRDGGHTFTPFKASVPLADDWLASAIAWTRGTRGPRLWAAAPAGALWVSDDLGATFQPSGVSDGVLKLHSDGARSLVAVCRGAVDGARASRSSDAGTSFHTLALPVSEVERVQDVQALGGVVLCCRRAPAPQLVWRSAAAGDWQELSAFACAPAALALEDEQVCVYFVVQNEQRRWLMRRVLAAHASPAQIVVDLPADAGAPLQLAVGQQEGVTTLQLGTERAWYRIRVQLAGDGA